MDKIKDNPQAKSGSKAQDNNMKLNFSVKNNSAIEFTTDGNSTSSGGIDKQVNILPLQTTLNTLTGTGTSGTWTGLVGNASWHATVNNVEVKITLDFSIPFDGSNSGSFTGDSNFNKYFSIDPNIAITQGDSMTLTATINAKN